MSTWAKVLLDSVNPFNGKRLTTLELNYPYIIHGEFMTHCAFARNGASTRAIPTRRLIQKVLDDPFYPARFPKSAEPDRGMSPDGFLPTDGQEHAASRLVWQQGVENAVSMATELSRLGVHKQIASRPLMPFMHQRMIVTATEFENFLNLRRHKDAQQEIQDLANAVGHALDESKPIERLEHLPLVVEDLPVERRFIVSAFRCARISYLQHDGKIDAEKDYARGLDLLSAGHMSPFEHQGIAEDVPRGHPSGKFRGWVQFRKTIKGEDVWVPR